VHEDRTLAVLDHLLDVVEGLEQQIDAVALDRPDVADQCSMSPGSDPRNSFAQPLMVRTMGFENLRDRKSDMAPTLGEIDISLSLSTTTRLPCRRCPA
jgi:hypothetical protein